MTENNKNDQNPTPETEISVNEYGQTPDAAVVVDEPTRTVILTPEETMIVDRPVEIDIPPAGRPPKVYTGMWGRSQIAMVAAGLLAVFAVVLLYIFGVVPSNRELQANRAERDRLEREMIEARSKYGDITSTQERVTSLVTSVNQFETNYLPFETTGRTALYQRLNGLIQAYGLVNTAGPAYAPLELADQANPNQSEQERGRSRFRSSFPGVYVTTTVEGTYQNLRRFIREIETGREFVVISSIQLEPSDTEEKQAAAPTSAPAIDPMTGMPIEQPAAPRRDQGKTHGSVVRLRLEMAAYFRRPAVEVPVAEPGA